MTRQKTATLLDKDRRTVRASNGQTEALAEPHSRSPTKRVRVVGIGASAGGLEAFTELLRHLPTDAGVAYVLVQHLDPTHRSLLSELLARVTTLPVTEIQPKSRVEPDKIYVIPPNCVLELKDGILRLAPRKKNGGPARSIDHFLKSLAEDQAEEAIAVILSGAGSDGAQGLKAVKAVGGLTFAQDERSAKYNSMPRSAAATGCVDFVLPPEKIAAEIARFVRHPEATKGRAAANARRRGQPNGDAAARWAQRLATKTSWPAAPADTNLRKIFLQLRAKTGTDFAFYKLSTIRRRLARRLQANKIKTLEGYGRFLREHPAEVDVLYQDLLIGVTSFFRNPLSFEILKRKVFPRLVRNHSGSDALRVWVAGCSTGQEAYSIAMAYSEFMEQSPTQVPIQIFATDLNAVTLDKARSARYTRAQMEGVSAKRLSRFFTIEDGHYRVQKGIRDMVVFAQHNLITDPPFTRVELITCRNVLIYLEAALQQKILPTFHYALKPEGILWLGSSEAVGQFATLFATLEKTHRIYVRKPAASWLRVDRPPVLPPTKRIAASFAPAPRAVEFSVLDAQKEADRVTLAKYTPASVLIDEELNILQFRGETGTYLVLPSGKATFNLLKMAREGLAIHLQKVVQRARKENRVARERGVRFGRGRLVNLEAVPLRNLKAPCFLVLFDKPPRAMRGRKAEGPLSRNGHGGRARVENAESRQEVTELREQLHSIQEEHETAVEELQASNEEVQSSNEELQSLNEELETSNEELESANEELTTLNEELATRNAELRESEQRLREQAQLLDMAPLLVRSPKDRIIVWSGGAEAMYGFTSEEAIGQTSHLLLNTHFYEPLEQVQAKLSRDGHWEGEVQHRRKDGRLIDVATKWVAHRDNDKKLRAILEVNTDITARKEAERALRASEEFNRSVLESSPDCIMVLDTGARIIFVTSGGQCLMEIEDTAAHTNRYWPAGWEGESRVRAEEAIREALAGRTGRFRGLCRTARGTPRWWDATVSPVFGPNEKPDKLLTVARDITSDVNAERARLQQARLHALRADISVTLLEAGELRATLRKICGHLIEHLDAAVARIWTLEDPGQVLELQASAGPVTPTDREHARVNVGESTVGRIALTRKPHLTNHFQNDPDLRDAEWAEAENIVAFAGYPLVVSGTVAGVVEIFAREPLAVSLVEELSFAANSVAQYVQRTWAEASRSKAQERLNRYAEDLERSVVERTTTLKQTIGELEAFSYSVSHDLRTPLRAMEGYSRALLAECGATLQPQWRGYLERISRGAQRLDRLILDVLAYSRLSRTEFTAQPIDLDKLITDIVEQYPQFEAAKAHIEIKPPLLPVLGHTALLTQCISNLLGNAIKFVKRGAEPKVKVWTEPIEDGVRLCVEDNGIGIAPQHRDRIFQIFGRVHGDKEYEGSGIGLAVVKRAVERMGGTVDFESELGRGARFWIDLPAEPVS